MAYFLGPYILSALFDDPIVTDRPDFTESSVVVALGKAQIETGATLSWDEDGARLAEFPETLLRYGVAGGAELRLGFPSYVSASAPGGRTHASGPLYLGAKFELPVRAGLEAALIPGLHVLTDRTASGQKFQPELAAAWATEVARGSLAGMLSATASEGNPVEWGNTLAFGFPVGRLGAFLEHAVRFRAGAPMENVLHTGLTFQPDPDTQWDVHFGVGLGRPAPRSFVGVGYSVRF